LVLKKTEARNPVLPSYIAKMKYSIIILLASSFFFTGCSKDEESDDGQNGGGGGIMADQFFQATLDGQVFTVQNLGVFDNIASREYLTASAQELQKMHILNVADPTANSAGMSIIKGFGAPGTCAQIQSMFATVTYPYGNSLFGVEGAKVFIVDSNGTPWSSDFGTGDQPGSTFEITSHVPSGDTLSMNITQATFNCILYNGTGGSMTLTDGFMESRSVKCP